MESRGCKRSQENTVGTQACACVSGEAINSIQICIILHCSLLFSYADGTFSGSVDGKPFCVIFADIASTRELLCHCYLLSNGHGKKTATPPVRLLSPTSPLHLLPQLI